MNDFLQTGAALGIVTAAVAGLVVRAVRKRGKPGCGGSCGCDAAALRKKALRKASAP